MSKAREFCHTVAVDGLEYTVMHGMDPLDIEDDDQLRTLACMALTTMHNLQQYLEKNYERCIRDFDCECHK